MDRHSSLQRMEILGLLPLDTGYLLFGEPVNHLMRRCSGHGQHQQEMDDAAA